MWTLTYKWAKHSHPGRTGYWVVARYFGMHHKTRRNRWVFGDRHSGAHLQKFAWTKIVRHQMVRHRASPDDPALTEYWADRRRKAPPLPTGKTGQRLLEAQTGRCPLCEAPLIPADDPPPTPHQWEDWMAATRTVITENPARVDGNTDEPELRLTHARCLRRTTARGNSPALLPASEP